MLAGDLYDRWILNSPMSANVAETSGNASMTPGRTKQEERKQILFHLFGTHTDAWIQPPFFCEYGTNIRLGTKVFFNFNCVVLDVIQVTIGDDVLFGPSVQIYTATHPLEAETRRKWLELCQTSDHQLRRMDRRRNHLPGVRIHDGAVIGAGSVVTRDVPNDVLAAGNLCSVIRKIVA